MKLMICAILVINVPFSALAQVIPDENYDSKYPDGLHLEFPEPLTKSEYKICVIGDAGTGKWPQHMVASALAEENCNQVRYLGDIVYSKGIDSSRFVKKWWVFDFPYGQVLNGDNKPKFFLAMGNHDYRSDPDAWLEIGRNDSQIVFPSRYYSEMWDNKICWFQLDTTPVANGIDRAINLRTQWYRQRSQELAEHCRFSVGWGHHPYLSSGKHSDASGRLKKFLEESVIGKLDVYFAGHDHIIADEGVRLGTRLLISGSAGRLYDVRRQPEDGFALSRYGYITLQFSEAGGEISMHYKFFQVQFDADWWQIFEDRNPVRILVRQGRVNGKGIR